METWSPQLMQEQKRWFQKPLFYVFGVALIVFGYFSFRFGTAYHNIVVNNTTVWESLLTLGPDEGWAAKDPYPMPKKEADRLDILVMGIRGEDDAEDGGYLADTLLLLSVDSATQKASLVSIPRDLYVDMLGVKGKINEIYIRGLERKQALALPKEIISRITGVYVDNAVVFDFAAFEEIVETLGGIEVTLSHPFVEPSQWGYAFELPAGKNILNGEQALYYVRSRYSTSDFDRARRQQEVILAIKQKALSQGYLTNPLKLSGLLASLKGNLKTDFQLWDAGALIRLGSSLSRIPIQRYTMTTENLLYEAKGAHGEYILLPKGDTYSQVQSLFATLLIPATPSPVPVAH